MHCASCGILLPPQAKVCPNCGTRVPGQVPASPTSMTPPPAEQTSYGGFASFQEAGPTISDSPAPLEKTVRQTPPAAPQEQYFAGYASSTPQEQFQFPDPPSFSPDQPQQPYQSYQSGQSYESYQPPVQPQGRDAMQAPQSPQQRLPFADSLQPPQAPQAAQAPQQYPAGAAQHYSDTTQQDVPAYNQPSYPAIPPQQPPFVGQPGQYTGPDQMGQPAAHWLPDQPFQPLQSPQSPQAAPRRRSTPLIIGLITAIILVIAGSFLVYYLGVARPAQLHAQATATVVTQLTSQAQGTAIANTHATGTAQAQANATTTAVAVATAQVQATMTAYVNMYTQATSGTPALNDPLTQNDANNWDIYSSNGSGCGFASGTLQATGSGGLCIARSTNFGDFAFQAKVNIVKGSSTTAGGLMFRLDRSTLKFYAFGIDTNGAYFLALFQVAAGKTSFQNLTSGVSQAISTGFNATNTLAILARGSNFYLYANNQYITHFSDTSSAAGAIGVFGSDNSSGVDVTFTNAEVWQA